MTSDFQCQDRRGEQDKTYHWLVFNGFDPSHGMDGELSLAGTCADELTQHDLWHPVATWTTDEEPGTVPRRLDAGRLRLPHCVPQAVLIIRDDAGDRTLYSVLARENWDGFPEWAREYAQTAHHQERR